jgi:hypothetical protein
MMWISFGLWAGYSLSSANTSLPTYQTSSNTSLMPFATSYRVISKMTLVASGLFITRRSIILQNISWVISLGLISMNLRWRASISMRTSGALVNSGIISFICSRKSASRCALYSGGLVQNLSSCRGLNWS